MRESVEAFGWLVVDTGDVLLWGWPISFCMFLLGLGAVLVGAPLGESKSRTALLRVACLYSFPVLTLLVATALRYELHGSPHPNWESPPSWFGYLLWTPSLAQLGLLIAIVFRSRGSRSRSVVAALPSFWLAMCALFPGAVAVSGVGP